jgi:hypothetical protein
MIGSPALICPTALFASFDDLHVHSPRGYCYGAKVMYCRCGASRTETIDAEVWTGWSKPVKPVMS